MSKQVKYYVAAWLVALLLFNGIVFTVNLATVRTFTPAFWINYGFITVSFLGQLICAIKALKRDTMHKKFYNVSLSLISYIGLIAMLLTGSICMVFMQIPYWVGLIGCFIILGVTAVFVISASAAVYTVDNIDQKVKTQTFIIKSLMMDAYAMQNTAKLPEIKDSAKKVYDALRFSDPMSNDALVDIESHIKEKFDVFMKAIKDENVKATESNAEELLVLICDRNNRCKLMK